MVVDGSGEDPFLATDAAIIGQHFCQAVIPGNPGSSPGATRNDEMSDFCKKLVENNFQIPATPPFSKGG